MFYVYLWLRTDGTPYYVGKGQDDRNPRAYIAWGHSVHRPNDVSRILVQPYESEDDAFIAEKFFIALYGRKDLGTGCLRNLTEGGEGTAGCIRTEEWKRRIGEANKGRKPKGYIRTEEHRQQLRDRMQGNRCGVDGNAGRWLRDMSAEYRKAKARKAAAARWGG